MRAAQGRATRRRHRHARERRDASSSPPKPETCHGGPRLVLAEAVAEPQESSGTESSAALARQHWPVVDAASKPTRPLVHCQASVSQQRSTRQAGYACTSRLLGRPINPWSARPRANGVVLCPAASPPLTESHSLGRCCTLPICIVRSGKPSTLPLIHVRRGGILCARTVTRDLRVASASCQRLCNFRSGLP